LRGQVQLRDRFLRSGDVRVYAHTESVSQNRALALRPGHLGREVLRPYRDWWEEFA
jgi:hypothetical protein